MSSRFLKIESPRPLILGSAALIGLIALGVALRGAASRAEEPTGAATPALPVELLEIRENAEYAVLRTHAGRVVTRRESALGFERSGLLVEVTHDQGDRVEAGALLARLDTRALRARRRELEAQREGIASELALARATAGRRSELYETGVVSPQNLDESVYARASLESRLLAAAASIEHLDVQLELSELRAPFAGVIAERYADEGTVLQPGAPLLRLLEDGALEVHVGMPQGVASGLEPASRHRIEVGGEEADAVLHTLLPTVDPETRTVTVVFRLESVPAAARHGALARVTLESRVERSGFWLPLTALAEGHRGLWTTYVAASGPNGLTAERRQVEVIHTEADRAFVRGTLFDGDRVVASGAHRIVPGVRVRAAREG